MSITKRHAQPEMSDQDDEQQHPPGLAAAEAKPELKQPSLYRVLLMNDDYTPMEFVVELIEQFFYKSRESATQIMLKIHTEGKGICGIYTEDVAETKAAVVNQYSMDHQHPLLCEIEPCNDDEES